MISYNSLRNIKLSDDVVKHKKCGSATIIKKCSYSLNPFSEIINDNDDITVPPVGGRITLNKINSPFGEGVDGDNGMQWSRVGMCLLLKNLVGWASFDNLDTIFEDGGPKITDT